MEKKEAVYYWENLRKTFSEYAEKEENIWAKQHYQFSVEAIDAALDALKMSETGEPLTIEQLRKMDGECVKVVVEGVEPLEMLALVEVPKDEDCVLLRNNLGGVSEFYSDEDLREDGVKVYAYPPAHIDWDAWEGCDFCQKELDDYPYVAARGDFSESDTCYKPSYCPICGKPITPEAQAELEKRLRGFLE